jgi:broad specificity phosphatase PhoE
MVVNHGGNIRFTLVGLGYGTLESIRGIQNCGYAILDYEEGKFSVTSAVGIKTE